jgi:trimeric autotransporter adhesin
VAVGKDALRVNTASANTVIGKGAGVAVTTGGYNVCIGIDCGDTLTTGNTNILIGNTARTSSASGSHQISMGVVATCVGDNNFTFGNQTTDSNIAFGATVITAPSDIRLKENIQDEEVGLDFINDLRPVTFPVEKRKRLYLPRHESL